MKIKRILLFLFIFALASCSPGNANTPTQTSMPEIASSIPITALPSTTTLAVYGTPHPLYSMIDEKNAGQLTLLHQWDVEGIFSLNPNTKLWFSDSNQFIAPIFEQSIATYHIQSFDVDRFAPTWFIKASDRETTIDEDNQVIVYLAGLHIFNNRGEEFKIPEAKDYCGETLASQIVAIPGTDIIVTGHQHYGDITNSYGTSRLLIWDKDQNSCSELLKQFVGQISSLSVSRDGHYISYSVITSRDTGNTILVETTTRIYDLNLQKEACHSVGLYAEFNRQNQLAVYSPKEGTISLILPPDCAAQSKINVGLKLSALAFSSSGNLLAGASDSTVDIWNVETGVKIGEINLDTSTMNSPFIGFSPDDRFLVTTKDKTSPTGKGEVMLWGIPGD